MHIFFGICFCESSSRNCGTPGFLLVTTQQLSAARCTISVPPMMTLARMSTQRIRFGNSRAVHLGTLDLLCLERLLVVVVNSSLKHTLYRYPNGLAAATFLGQP
jgi:hypothetical protein